MANNSKKAAAPETYTLPDWFLESNVITSAETADVQPRIRFPSKDEGENESWDDTWEGFYVSRDAYDGVHDTIPSLMVPMNDSAKQALLLYSGASGTSEFFRELILHLSQTLDVNFVSTNLTALENLAWDFELQDQKARGASTSKAARADTTELSGPLSFYFGSEGSVATGNRSIKSYATLLGACAEKEAKKDDAKMTETSAEASDEAAEVEGLETSDLDSKDESSETMTPEEDSKDKSTDTEGSETYEVISTKDAESETNGVQVDDPVQDSGTKDPETSEANSTKDQDAKATGSRFEDAETTKMEFENQDAKTEDPADKVAETKENESAEVDSADKATDTQDFASGEEGATDKDCETNVLSRPLLMHVHCSTDEFTNVSNSTLWTRLREALARRGKKGNDCALVITVGQPPAESTVRIPLLIQGLETYWMNQTATETLKLENASIQEFNPLHTTKAMFGVRGFGRAYQPVQTNYLHLEYVLRSRTASRAVQGSGSCPVQALRQWYEFNESAAQVLDGSVWTGEQIFQAVTQIIGRAHLNSEIGAQDIQAVLERSKRLGDEKSRGEVKDKKDGEKGKMEEKLEQVRSQCNEFESELLNSVVNPDDITSGYDDVILEDDIKETIKLLVSISNLRSRAKAKSSFITGQIQLRGALLYGPPGTGKTHLARAVAKSANHFMLSVDGAEVTSKWVGETEKYIKGVFSLATKLAPCVVFMDEVDSLFRKRKSDDRSWERAAITQFLAEMDGLGKRKGGEAPFVLVATNRPMDLDDAFMRRLPQQCFVGLPSQAARAQILRLFLNEEDLDPSVDIDALAEKTKGYSGSDLRSLCAETGLRWVMEQNIAIPESDEEGEEEQELQVCLKNDHFAKALRKIRPSVTAKCIKDLERFRDRSFGTVENKETEEAKPLKSWEEIATEDRGDRLVLPVIQPPAGCLQNTRHTIPYAALPTPTSIRLLRLQRLPSDADDLFAPIRCSVVVRDLDRNPAYLALSYTWGDPLAVHGSDEAASPEAWSAPAFEISCNGQLVSVATNLYTALVAIRWQLSAERSTAEWVPSEFTEWARSGPGSAPLDIWIDALCINQDDLAERAHQVTIMDRIYASARATVMWIGGEDSLMTAARPFFEIPLRTLPSKSEAAALEIRDDESYEKLGMDPIPEKVWAGLVGVYGRRYFKRAWVVQEWVRSRAAVMMCGLCLMDPFDLASRLLTIHELGWWAQLRDYIRIRRLGSGVTLESDPVLDKIRSVPPIYSLGADTMPLSIMQSMMALKVHLGHVDRPSQFRLGLAFLADSADASYTFQSFRESLASDPRDKVFAFLGLLREFKSRSGEDEMDALAPDYTSPSKDVYTAAAEAMVRGPAGLGWLAFKEDTPAVEGLPSWVPDLTVSHYSMSAGAVPFAASYGLPGSQVRVGKGSVLCAAGHVLDAIVSVLKVDDMMNFDALPELLAHIPAASDICQPHITGELRWWWDMYSRRRKPIQEDLDSDSFESDEQDRYEVLWRTLLLDMWENSSPAQYTKGSALLRQLEHVYDVALRRVVLCDLAASADFVEDMSRDSRRYVEDLNAHPVIAQFKETCDLRWGPYDRAADAARLDRMKAALLQLVDEDALSDKVLASFRSWRGYRDLLGAAQTASYGEEMEAWGVFVKEAVEIVTDTMTNDSRQAAMWTGDWYKGRYLFATAGGKLGLTASRPEVDDRVWLLPGADVPLVMRAAGDEGQWRLVGEAYVHGSMYGVDLASVELQGLEIV